jgi:CopG family nickel-responsive transcriptional regulator
MQRVTITFDDDLLSELDEFMTKRGYQNRSETLRDLTRAAIRQESADVEEDGNCVAALVYVYQHSTRQLPKRLSNAFHDHHGLSVASTHAQLDNENCFEMAMLRGEASKVRDFAQHVIAERGVRHGQLLVIPTPICEEKEEGGSEGRQKRLEKPHSDQAISRLRESARDFSSTGS